jgi:group I intron endonuclease
MIKSGIYAIQNVVDKKIYIGSSKNIRQRKNNHFNRLRKNKHENAYLQNAFNKYGEDNFVFSILLECSIEYIGEEEKKFIALYNSANREWGYNICPDIHNKTVSDETRKKLSVLARNRTAEHRKNLSIGHMGWNPSEETRKRMSLSHIGYIMPEEQRKNIGKALAGRKKSEETRKKMSERLRGKVLSEETRKKISKTLTGRHPSEESRLKMSIAVKKYLANGGLLKRVGRKLSETHKKHISESLRKRYKKDTGKE